MKRPGIIGLSYSPPGMRADADAKSVTNCACRHDYSLVKVRLAFHGCARGRQSRTRRRRASRPGPPYSAEADRAIEQPSQLGQEVFPIVALHFGTGPPAEEGQLQRPRVSDVARHRSGLAGPPYTTAPNVRCLRNATARPIGTRTWNRLPRTVMNRPKNMNRTCPASWNTRFGKGGRRLRRRCPWVRANARSRQRRTSQQRAPRHASERFEASRRAVNIARASGAATAAGAGTANTAPHCALARLVSGRRTSTLSHPSDPGET